jgi:hypothetical protein
MTRLPALPSLGAQACAITIAARSAGPLETMLFGVTAHAQRGGEPAHIGIKFGRILIYLEDRAALDSLVRITRQAEEMATANLPTPRGRVHRGRGRSTSRL